MSLKQGIQLYTVRDYIKNYEDADETFAFIKGFGCDVIQISGIGSIEPQKVKELVEKYEFDVCVTHKPFDRMLHDLDALIEEHKMIGCDMIGLGSMPTEYRDSLESAREFAQTFQKISEKVAKKGLSLAYHNHDFEFQKFENDKTIMDVLLEETDPATVKLIPDVAWVQWAGINPCDFLNQIGDRVKVVHMKDYIDQNGDIRFVEFGDGLVDFDAIYQTCMRLNLPYAVYEQDSGWTKNAKDSCLVSFKRMIEAAKHLS